MKRKNDFYVMGGAASAGSAIGASLMYFFDPAMGRRRRAIARDKMGRLARKTREGMEAGARDFGNRARGLIAESEHLFSRRDLSDSVLADRIRAELGFLVRHPSSIHVRVENGNVSLSGAVLEDEVHRLVRRLSSMRGITHLENRLKAYRDQNLVPGLQGKHRMRTGQKLDIMQSHWSPATRLVVGTAAAASLLYAAARRDLAGAGIALLGGGALARALSNSEFKKLLGIEASLDVISIQKTINIAAPVEQVFSFWSNYENFPNFMSNVHEVKRVDDHRSHWVVAGPAGARVEWEAIVTSIVPNQLIAWETAPGSPIQHAGRVKFKSNAAGGTRLDLRLSYNPIAGVIGRGIAAVFGADPKSEMDQDLMRMKNMIETGVPPHDASGKTDQPYVH